MTYFSLFQREQKDTARKLIANQVVVESVKEIQ